jgi:hypothetical protein
MKHHRSASRKTLFPESLPNTRGRWMPKSDGRPSAWVKSPDDSAWRSHGDLARHDSVTVDELLRMVNVALGNAGIETCNAGDANHDGSITIDEILKAVNNALSGCPNP